MPRREYAKASAWAIDYKKCTLVELRKFIKARIGIKKSKTLRSSRSDKLSLITRLRKLDHAATFPRFMELPPELRLVIYDSLLTDTRVRSWSGYDAPALLHPAILCTSKQVYSEALPVLYEEGNLKKLGKVV